MVDRIVRSKEEWRHILPREQFEVTRNNGTEPAFNNRYWNNHEEGIYRCADCDLDPFSSETEYESGTGWPSFWSPIAADRIKEEPDVRFGMVRTGVNCARCDAHLGHVFEDGPPPTGLRYCLNSAALKFEAKKPAMVSGPFQT